MSKVISNKDAENCQSWILPSVGEQSQKSNNNILTASQLEEVQKQAYDEAYAVGLAEGIEAGKQSVQEKINSFQFMLSALSTPFSDLDKQVDEELVVLVQTLVRQMVRREIKQEPGEIMAVVREAMQSLPVSSRQLQIRLNPEDALLVQDFYKTGDQELAWDIIEDPLISRGGCKVITAVSEVDATLETRLNQLFAHVFGERQKDSDNQGGD